MNCCRLTIFSILIVFCMNFMLITTETVPDEKSLLYVIQTIYDEATGQSEFLWESNTDTTDEPIRKKYHKKAAQFIWIWFNLTISMEVTRVMEKAIIQTFGERDIRYLDSIKDVDYDMVTTTLDNFEKISKINTGVNTQFLYVDNKIGDNFGVNDSLISISRWPYFKNNPRPNIRLHLQFILLALAEFDSVCLNILAKNQRIARTVLYMAKYSDSSISEKIISTYHRNNLYTFDRVDPQLYSSLVGNNNVLCTKRIVQFNIDPALHFLIMELYGSDVYKKYESDIRNEKHPPSGSSIDDYHGEL